MMDKTKIKRYFVTGLLVIIPIWGTFLILKTLFVALDGVFGNLLKGLTYWYIPGIGIILLVAVVFLAGVFATNVVGNRMVRRWEEWVERVPVVHGIYATLKSMTDILSIQQTEKFRKVVMIQFPKNGHYCFAFVTGVIPEELQHVSEEKLVNVYVPTAPNPTSGYFLLVPESEIVPLSISVDDAMKMIVSGGLYVPNSHYARGQDLPFGEYATNTPAIGSDRLR